MISAWYPHWYPSYTVIQRGNGTGNGMALIFPRAAAFAERMWSNPAALRVEDMTGGTPPGHYWQSHLKDALSRLNEAGNQLVTN